MGWKEDAQLAAEQGDEDAKKALDAVDAAYYDGDASPFPPIESPGSNDKPLKQPKDQGFDTQPTKDGKPIDDDDLARDGGADQDGKGRDSKGSPIKFTPPKKASLAERLAYQESLPERRRLLASRSDLPFEKRQELAGAAMGIVRWACANLPRVSGGARRPEKTHVDAALVAHIDRAMGVHGARHRHDGVQHRDGGHVLSLGPMTPEQASARLAEIEREEAAGLR